MHVIRLVHPCGTVVVPGPGGRRIGGETVSEGTYHAAATGDLNVSQGRSRVQRATPDLGRRALPWG